MKKIVIFLAAIALAINLHGQDADSFVGKYSVIEIRSEVWGSEILSTDTTSYFIDVVKYNDTLIAMSFFAALDTVKATVISDSIEIFMQTLYLNEWNYYIIKGSGRLYGDTLKYQYTNGGPRGAFEGNCIAVKVNGNSINELDENEKSLNCFPNPFSDKLYVDLDIPQNISSAVLDVYGINGRLIQHVDLSQRGKFNKTLDLGNLGGGIYYCVLLLNNKPNYSAKIIKK